MDITHPFGGLIAGRPMMLERKAFECLMAQCQQAIADRHMLNFASSEKKKPYAMYQDIAVISVHGALSKRPGLFDAFFGLTSYEVLENSITQALNDSDVSGIMLDVDSPGGEVSGLFDLADFIYSAREIKPIWAFSNDDAYSAAYAIASSAEKVFVTRTGGVGSIGVIATHVDQSSFDEKLGVKYTTIYAGNRKNDFNPHAELTTEASKLLQKEIDRLYEMFVSLVSRNRDISEREVRNTEAGLFFGESSLSAGLADQVLTMPDALNLLKLELQPKPKRNVMTNSINTPQAENQTPQAAAETEAPETQEQTPEVESETDGGDQVDQQTDGDVDAGDNTQEAETEAETDGADDAGDAGEPAASASAHIDETILAVKKAERENVMAEITELSKACDVAGMPEKLGEFIEKGFTAEQAKDELMKLMASNNQQPEIHSQTTPASSAENESNPVVETAKARAEQAQQS